MSTRKSLVQVDGVVQELPAGDSLIDDAARRRTEVYALQQREMAVAGLQTRSRERIGIATLNRSTGAR